MKTIEEFSAAMNSAIGFLYDAIDVDMPIGEEAAEDLGIVIDDLIELTARVEQEYEDGDG